MSMIRKNRRQVNPTRTSVVLFDATEPRPAPANFGKGLLRSLPSYRMPFTAADVAEAAQMFGELSDRWDSETGPDAVIDRREYESACLDRYVQGRL